MTEKIGIVGGGLAGLVLGWQLSKKGKKVIIWEKENFLGGLLADFDFENTRLERTYHHIFKNDEAIIRLIEELGLKKKLEWKQSSIGQYCQGRMYPFVTAVDLLKFTPLGLANKLKLGAMGLWLQKSQNWQSLKRVKAVDWLKKWGGEKNYQLIWKPLLKGKFGKYYNQVSMAWLWARVYTRGRSKQRGGKEELGYLRGGWGQIIKKLAEEIKKNGGEINLNQEIKEIKKVKKTVDKLVVCWPDKKIKYLGFVNVVFSSSQSLSPYYWHNIGDESSPFLVFIQQTNLVDKKRYNNRHVYYLGAYLPQEHKYMKAKNEVIYRDFFVYLKKIYPQFETKLIKNKKIFRFRFAQHVVDTNYQAPSYKLSKNVYRMNFAQIFPWDRGSNYAVVEAKKMAKMVDKE